VFVRAADNRIADRVEHDSNVDACEFKMSGHLNAIKLADVLIEDEHVRLQFVDEHQRRHAAGTHADNLQIGLGVHQGTQLSANSRFIVSDNHAQPRCMRSHHAANDSACGGVRRDCQKRVC
jgi:hypothetical protein